jgi:hypothetical protein
MQTKRAVSQISFDVVKKIMILKELREEDFAKKLCCHLQDGIYSFKDYNFIAQSISDS